MQPSAFDTEPKTSRKSQKPHLKRTEPLESGNRSNETIPVLRRHLCPDALFPTRSEDVRGPTRSETADPRDTQPTTGLCITDVLRITQPGRNCFGSGTDHFPYTADPDSIRNTDSTGSRQTLSPSAAISTTAAHASRASPSVHSISSGTEVAHRRNRHRTAVGNWPWHRAPTTFEIVADTLPDGVSVQAAVEREVVAGRPRTP